MIRNEGRIGQVFWLPVFGGHVPVPDDGGGEAACLPPVFTPALLRKLTYKEGWVRDGVLTAAAPAYDSSGWSSLVTAAQLLPVFTGFHVPIQVDAAKNWLWL